jgi:hypothetical protein
MSKNTIPNSGKISVGCKLPHGLHLDIGDTRVTLKGANDAEIIGGHGITENVDAAFFAKWCELNHQHPALENNLIFAQAKTADVKAQAKEQKNVKTGFEGINPAAPGDGVKPDEKQQMPESRE